MDRKSHEGPPETGRMAERVLLVGWDAADWKVITPLLDAGLMPNLERIVNEGVMGNLATLEPALSPMLWTSIATGMRADRHGILGFVEPSSETGGIQPVTSTSRKGKAVWNILTQAGLRSNVLGWFASHPAEPIRGAIVSNLYPRSVAPLGQPWPLRPGTVHPPRLEDALAELRIHSGEIEGAHLIPFVPRASEIDTRKDTRLATLAKILAECSTLHAAATSLMENEPWDFMAVYYDAIDHFCHSFMPYHPPRMPGVSEDDFKLYRDVVNSAYRYHDMMLGRLLDLAGEDTTVMLISDHGFHSDHLRPTSLRNEPTGPVDWHRPFGVFCMKGPHIRRDERIDGAGLLDITPTVLTLLGLPVGDDMDGRPLVQAFREPPAVRRIPSWDLVEGECGMHPDDHGGDPLEAQEVIEQLVALGYIEPLEEDAQTAVSNTVREWKANLARAQMDAGRHAEAATCFEELLVEQPDATRLELFLAQCRFALGEMDDCRRVVQRILDREKSSPFASLLLGTLYFADGDCERAIECLLEAEQANPRLPGLHVQIGHVYLRLRRWSDAERAFCRALGIDCDSPHAHHGLAVACLRQGRCDEAAEEALAAVGLQHDFPKAHFHLAVALARLGQPERARQGFETCLAQRPKMPSAHRWLARIWEQAYGDSDRAAIHRQIAEELGLCAAERRLDGEAELSLSSSSSGAPSGASSGGTPPVESAAAQRCRTHSSDCSRSIR